MRKYPEHVTIDGKGYVFEKILNDDFFSVNVLYANAGGERYVLKLSDFRFIGGFLFRPFASLMSRREYRMYQKVADVEGVPELGPRVGRRGISTALSKERPCLSVTTVPGYRMTFLTI